MLLGALSMTRIRLFILLAVVPVLLVACGGGGSKPKVPGDAVAVVGDKPITKSEFDSYLATAKRSYAARRQTFPKAGTKSYNTLTGQLMTFLVERSEYDQEAKKMGVKVTDKQIADRLQQVKKQYFGIAQPGQKAPTAQVIEQRYRAQIRKSGLTDQDVRNGLRYQLIREGIYKKLTDSVKISDSDVKSYYDKHKKQYTQPATPESRDVRHILVKTHALAQQIYRKLKGGADFTKMVQRYSTDTGSKPTGGRLTVCKKNSVGCIKTVAPFERVAFSLRPNEISKPVHTKYGWHIIQALGPVRKAQKSKVIPFDQVKEAIRQQLVQTKRQTVTNDWWKKTKKDYAKKTSYRTGYEPAPTTSTQTSTSQ